MARKEDIRGAQRFQQRGMKAGEAGFDALEFTGRTMLWNSLEEVETKAVRASGKQNCWTTLSKRVNSKLRTQHLSSHKWTRIFFFLSLSYLMIDPLFFYIFVIDDTKKYLGFDEKLRNILLIFRTISDVIHIFCIFYTGLVDPSSPVIGDDIIFQYTHLLLQRLRSRYFFFNIPLVLPLPQVWLLFVISNIKGPASFVIKDLPKFVFIFVLFPRIIRACILAVQFSRHSQSMIHSPYVGVVVNLTGYLIACHIIGASWYFLSIDRKVTCWLDVCANHKGCIPQSLFHEKSLGDKTFLNKFCSIGTPQSSASDSVTREISNFDFGIYADALQSGIVSSRDFIKKYSYCFWWGLRNLSSLGQGLNTSTFFWETSAAIAISVVGLILICSIIGHVQAHFFSSTAINHINNMREKHKNLSQLMSMYKVPRKLRKEIQHCRPYEWHINSEIDLQNLFRYLPYELGRQLEKHIQIALLERVPQFRCIADREHEQLRDQICSKLNLQPYDGQTNIVNEKEKIDKMVFIIKGKLKTCTTEDGVMTTSLATHEYYHHRKKKIYLRDGDFFGEQLLDWATASRSSKPDCPTPTWDKTIWSMENVVAFVLRASDIEDLVSKNEQFFEKLPHFQIPRE